MIYNMNAPAKAVKGRASSRKKVSYFEAPAFESVQKPVAAARQTSATVVGQAAAQVTGGKARKTGMLLARAKLGTATSEVAATRDRQSTLLSKGRYRDAELTAREAPTGTLNIASMPKRKEAVSTAAQKEAMNTWMKKTYSGKVSRCVLELCARFDRACTD